MEETINHSNQNPCNHSLYLNHPQHRTQTLILSPQEGDSETLGEVSGNKGKSCGSESLGVVMGEGCK